MASTVFSPGTVVTSPWLNDVNTVTYGSAVNVKTAPYGAVGNGVADDTAALQAAITYAGANQKSVYLPAGNYKISSTLVANGLYLHLFGDGENQSKITFNGVTGGAITTVSQTYFRPYFHDFSLYGDSTSGPGIDLTNVTSQVYLGSFERMFIQAGAQALKIYRTFSFSFKNIKGYSYNENTFLIGAGPAVDLINCYAVFCGPGKCGYRMSGNVNLYACNGIDWPGPGNANCDYWGVFGQDPAGPDGFGADFPGGISYPDIHLDGCNIENFRVGGIYIHQSYQSCFIRSCKIDSTTATTLDGFLFDVRSRLGPTTGGVPIIFEGGSYYKGAGLPSYGFFYSDNGAATFLDRSGGALNNISTTWRNNAASISVPLMVESAASDIFGDSAIGFNAINPRRITVQTLRYRTLVFTPTAAANQTIDVTGYTKLQLGPSGAYSVSKFTFNTTIGVGLDYQRNGELIIEATTANLTLLHNVAGAFGMRMIGGANLTLAQGQVVKFMWSDNYTPGVGGWVQI